MTSENSQIQALLQQIDEVLHKTNPRLPWVMSSDAVQQRQVLEQTRNYLLSLQQNGMIEAAPTDPGAMAPQSAAAMEASAQQVLQAVVQEMNYLRSNMMQPLRSDVEMLRLQRDALTQEIRQLEMQRQQYGLPQQSPQYLTDFLQGAMAQMQENITRQVSQLIAANSAQFAGRQPAGLLEGDAALNPVERLERLQHLQAQSDQLMLRLDTTLRSVFDALQRNLESYQDSLEEGLGRMHGMGQQGEAVFGAFVTRLGQILGREASSFLQSSQGRGDRPSLPGQQSGVDERSASQINRLWEELNALDQTLLNRVSPGEPVPFATSGRAGARSGFSETELQNLEELDRVLSQLDLSVIPDVDELDDELVLLPEEEEFSRVAPDQAAQQTPGRTIETDPDRVGLRSAQVTADEDLESAIDLLNQITADIPVDTRRRSNRSGEDRDDRVAAPPPDETLIASPDALYEDEFYQTLFTQDETSSAPAEQEEQAEAAIDRAATKIPAEDGELEQSAPTPELDEDLFAGLAELIESNDSGSMNLEPIDAAPLPQSVESWLLQPPAAARPVQDETLDSFFEQEAEQDAFESEEADAAENTEEEVETIAALTDLIPPDNASPSDSSPPDSSPFFVEPPRLMDFADEYEVAHAGEDLFGNEATDTGAIGELGLSSDTLQQLSADLFNLEDAPTGNNQTDWTLGDLQDSPSVEPAQPTEGVEWSLTDIPSILLSQPFSGQMTAEDLLFADGWIDEPSPEDLPSGNLDSENLTSENLISDSTTLEPSTDLASPEPDIQPNVPADALLESTLEDWFSAVDGEPVVSPETTRDAAPPDPTSTTGFTLEEFAAEVTPLAAEDDADSLNAFTLDGLDSLFEGVPSIDAPPASGTDTQTVTVDNIFGNWNDAATEPPVARDDRSIPPDADVQESSSPAMRQQKKKFGSRESAD